MFSNKSKREAAEYCIKKCDFHFTQEIKRSMFAQPEMYQSFVTRAKELGFCREKTLTFREKLFHKGPILEYSLGENSDKDYETLIRNDISTSSVLDKEIDEAKEKYHRNIEENLNRNPNKELEL